MGDDSGRVMWLWGPLLLLGVLVLVFRLAERDGSAPTGSQTKAGGSEVSSVRALGDDPASISGQGTMARSPGGAVVPGPGYPPSPGMPVPYYWSPPIPPPWGGGYGWGPVFRPGDHSGRYWGTEAEEWGPPVGEYGPDAPDPYWWVRPRDLER